MKKRYLLLLLSMMAANTFAADTVVTMKDGRKVVLHDDFTWEYVIPKVPSNIQSSKYDEQTKVPEIEAIPVISNERHRLAEIQLGTKHNLLQVSQSGVELLFKAAYYESGELVIPVNVTNNSKASVISVEVSYQLYDSQEQRLKQGEAKVWTSVKRLPDTYLRPGKQAKGIDLRIPIGELASYDFKAEISDITTRN